MLAIAATLIGIVLLTHADWSSAVVSALVALAAMTYVALLSWMERRHVDVAEIKRSEMR